MNGFQRRGDPCELALTKWKEVSVECRENGVVMATEDCAHRDLRLRSRRRFEGVGQLITPFQELTIELSSLVGQLFHLLGFEVLPEAVDAIYLPTDSPAYPIQITESDEACHERWLRFGYHLRSGEELLKVFVVDLEGILCIAVVVIDA